jgi:hypothetical protein
LLEVGFVSRGLPAGCSDSGGRDSTDRSGA